MIGHCLNPECNEELRYLRHGSVYVFQQSNPPHGAFMSLSHEIRVPDPHSPQQAIFAVLKPTAKSLTRSPAPAPRLKSKSARSTLEYENPDLTLPSVSSF